MNKVSHEEVWEQWSDEVLSQGNVDWYCNMYEKGNYYWCFTLDSGIQRFATNMPEHIQRKLGVSEDSIVPDMYLRANCYWGKRARESKAGETNE